MLLSMTTVKMKPDYDPHSIEAQAFREKMTSGLQRHGVKHQFSGYSAETNTTYVVSVLEGEETVEAMRADPQIQQAYAQALSAI